MTPTKLDFTPIRIIHGALCLGPFMFGTMVNFAMVQHDTASNAVAGNEIMLAILASIGIGGFIIGKILFNMKISSVTNAYSMQDKLGVYVQANIVKFALLEGPILFGLVSYLLNNNYLYLYLTLVFYALMLLSFPSKDKFADAFELSSQQREDLQR